jgi:hypothetical protein
VFFVYNGFLTEWEPDDILDLHCGDEARPNRSVFKELMASTLIRGRSFLFMALNDYFQILFLGIGMVFGLIAAVMAYLILYQEYLHHFMGDTKQPKKMALQGALFTFVFFLALSLAGGYILVRFVISR